MQTLDNVLQTIVSRIGEDAVYENEPMRLHTSMEVGGPARYLFQPKSEEDLRFLLQILQENEYPFYVKGNGSNLLFPDEGFDGAIIEIRSMQNVTITGEEVYAEAGILLKDLSDRILAAELTGFEFASGIPGSLGGAVCMNAGAYDGEMKDIVQTVRVMTKDGEIQEKTNAEMEFSYRRSACSNGDLIVLGATLKLQKGDPEAIKAKIDDLTARREEKQPLEYPSCGSVFKRPEGYFAGKLISDAGLKGYTIGGAQVSEKHAGFIINRGGAKAQDVLDLIAYVQKTVEEQFHVKLECEVKILSCLSPQK